MPPTRTIYKYAASLQAPTWPLRPPLQFLHEIELIVLSYFDTSPWSSHQIEAYNEFNHILRSEDFRRGLMSITNPPSNATMSHLISLIGRMFFLNGLENVHFEWAYEPAADWQAKTTVINETGKTTIAFNRTGQDYRGTDENTRPNFVRNELLHECIHGVISRYASDCTNNNTPQHDVVWVSIARAI